MKPTYFSLLSILTLFATATDSSAQWTFNNIGLLSRFDDVNVVPEPTYGIRYQGCWGWTDPSTQREYGIIGSSAGTYFVEVTDPYQPVQRDYVPGRSTNRIWHEYKSYGNYLYIISDGGGNTLQIADMSYLPDSVHIVYDSTGIFDSGHTLYVDGNRLYVASVSRPGSFFSSMNVYSLTNPARPSLLRRLDQDFPAIGSVHDMFVMNDTVYASCGNQGLYVFRYDTVLNRFTQLGSLVTYPDAGYNHSTFMDASHQVLYMCDEVPDGMAVKVVDVTDVSNMVVVDTFYSNAGATAHNPYVLGDELFIAYYQDGIQAYDLTDPRHPVHEGYFDTYPNNPAGTYFTPAYKGCWGAYTDLPSGHLLASDMQQGLFVLDISQVMAQVPGIHVPASGLKAYPNPTNTVTTLSFPSMQDAAFLEVTDVAGRAVWNERLPAGSMRYTMDTSSWPGGIYLVRVNDVSTSITTRIAISR